MKLLAFIWTIAVLACSQTAPSGREPTEPDPGGSTLGTGDQKSDWAAIEKLENEAKALAVTSGCSASGECRTAAVGSRPCGGPRYYLPYCTKTTDSAALFAKLSEVARAEEAYNRKYGIGSTCEFRMPPDVVAVDGVCVAR